MIKSVNSRKLEMFVSKKENKMRKLILIGFSLLCASVSSAALLTNEEIQKQLDNTQWTGVAGIGLFGNYKAGNTVDMAFQVQDGKLFYLSKINNLLDGSIEKKAQGLCVKSPPREVTFFPSEDGKSLEGRVILPEVIEETGEIKFYSIPVNSVSLNKNFFKFNSIPITLGKKGKVRLNVSYIVGSESTEVSNELAVQLRDCLEKKPWIKKAE